MSTTSYLREVVTRFWNATPLPIPTSNSGSPDFLVVLNDCTVLFEEKTKKENPDQAVSREFSLAKGEPYESATTIIRNNRISGIVKKAADQLNAPEVPSHDFRVLWITAEGAHAKAKHDQIQATLYGTASVYALESEQGLKRCFFFENSDFYRLRDRIDAAVVCYIGLDGLHATLCINPLSPRAAALLQSSLASRFGRAVQDPLCDEAEGLAYILDGDVDRKNEDACLAYLQSKYRLGPLQRMNIGYSSLHLPLETSRH